jgi:hypothetical protein
LTISCSASSKRSRDSAGLVLYVTYSLGVPRSMPAITRPPVMVSSMANSSATRTGFWMGMLAPSRAILARLTRWVRAPAMTIGLGVSDSGAKWCSATLTQSKPSSSASWNCSRLHSTEASAVSSE